MKQCLTLTVLTGLWLSSSYALASGGSLAIKAGTVATLIPFPGPCIQATFNSTAPFNALLLEDGAEKAFAKGSFAGAPTSALQYQGFCGNVTACQIVANGLSETFNYTLAVFAQKDATIEFDLSLTCVNNVDVLSVVVFATLPAQSYTAIPADYTSCYSFFAQAVNDGDTFNTFLTTASDFRSWARGPKAASNVTDTLTCSTDYADCYTLDYALNPANSTFVHVLTNPSTQPVSIFYATYPYCAYQYPFYVEVNNTSILGAFNSSTCYAFAYNTTQPITTGLFEYYTSPEPQLLFFNGSDCVESTECAVTATELQLEGSFFVLLAQNNGTRPAAGTLAQSLECSEASASASGRKLLASSSSSLAPLDKNGLANTLSVSQLSGAVNWAAAAAMASATASGFSRLSLPTSTPGFQALYSSAAGMQPAAPEQSIQSGRKMLQATYEVPGAPVGPKATAGAPFSPLQGYVAARPATFGTAAAFSEERGFLPTLFIRTWPASLPLASGLAIGGLAGGSGIITLSYTGSLPEASPIPEYEPTPTYDYSTKNSPDSTDPSAPPEKFTPPGGVEYAPPAPVEYTPPVSIGSGGSSSAYQDAAATVASDAMKTQLAQNFISTSGAMSLNVMSNIGK